MRATRVMRLPLMHAWLNSPRCIRACRLLPLAVCDSFTNCDVLHVITEEPSDANQVAHASYQLWFLQHYQILLLLLLLWSVPLRKRVERQYAHRPCDALSLANSCSSTANRSFNCLLSDPCAACDLSSSSHNACWSARAVSCSS